MYQMTSKLNGFKHQTFFLRGAGEKEFGSGFAWGLAQLSQERRDPMLAGQHHPKAQLGQQGPLSGSLSWLLMGGLPWGLVGPSS